MMEYRRPIWQILARLCIIKFSKYIFLNISEDAFVPASENRDKYGRLLKIPNLKKEAIPTLFLDSASDDPLNVSMETQEFESNSNRFESSSDRIQDTSEVQEHSYYCGSMLGQSGSLKTHIESLYIIRRKIKYFRISIKQSLSSQLYYFFY